MRKKIVLGNWKMNMTETENENWINNFIKESINISPNHLLGIAPPFIHINSYKSLNNLIIGAQNCSEEEQGAYTGEISVKMLKSIGAKFCIVGHSERRLYFKESNETLVKKINILHKYNLLPVFCIGENLKERENNTYKEVIKNQLINVLNEIDISKEIIIAYEPVWAIGTGKTATSYQAQEAHSYIRKLLYNYSEDLGETTPILYGGSCNQDNAVSLFKQLDIDGGLIGGASLEVSSLISIYNALK